MHSWPIMVESMSARRSFLRRSPAGCTTTSIGQVAAKLAQPLFDGVTVAFEVLSA